MATASSKLPPMPAANVPMVDPKTGIVTPDWYPWLKVLESIVRTLRTEV